MEQRRIRINAPCRICGKTAWVQPDRIGIKYAMCVEHKLAEAPYLIGVYSSVRPKQHEDVHITVEYPTDGIPGTIDMDYVLKRIEGTRSNVRAFFGDADWLGGEEE